MSDIAPKATHDTPMQSRGRSRLWLWYVAGFLVTFIGMAAAFPMSFYDGRAVFRSALWHYYLLEFRHAWNSAGQLGPAPGNASAVVTVALQHVMLSLAGGAILFGIGWITARRSRATK